jgi:hypothetical protein
MINGRVDLIRRDLISGWCADYDDPKRILELLVYVDGTPRGRFPADRQRPDLRALRIYGEGNHGFSIELTPPLSLDEDHEIVVRPVGGWGSLERGRVRLLKELVGEPAIFVLEEEVTEEPHNVWGSPKYVLHIGPHKTGSTYLQMAFNESRNSLLDGGVFYPDTVFGWVGHGGSSHAEFHRLLADLDTRELPSSFNSLNSSDHKIVLISSEDLVGISRQGLRYLRSLFGWRPVEVVYYCRRWSDLLPSAWQETVKQGELHGLGEFLAVQFADPIKSSIINFDIVLSKFVEVFGIRSVRLVSYNHLVDSGIDLYDHFVRSIIGLDTAPRVTRVTPNQSLDPAEVELLRVLNGIASIRQEATGIDIFRRYWPNRFDPDARSLISGMAEHMDSARVDDASPGLRGLHEFLFAKYRDGTVGPGSGFNLFHPEIRDVAYVRDTHLLTPGVIEKAGGLYDRIFR